MAFGSEFGGQKDKKVSVIYRKGRTRKIIKRRTTMQFRKHQGQRGYWMIPTMQQNFPETLRKTTQIVQDVLEDIPFTDVIRGRVTR